MSAPKTSCTPKRKKTRERALLIFASSRQKRKEVKRQSGMEAERHDPNAKRGRRRGGRGPKPRVAGEQRKKRAPTTAQGLQKRAVGPGKSARKGPQQQGRERPYKTPTQA